jgi:hypothetical protein
LIANFIHVFAPDDTNIYVGRVFYFKRRAYVFNRGVLSGLLREFTKNLFRRPRERYGS